MSTDDQFSRQKEPKGLNIEFWSLLLGFPLVIFIGSLAIFFGPIFILVVVGVPAILFIVVKWALGKNHSKPSEE